MHTFDTLKYSLPLLYESFLYLDTFAFDDLAVSALMVELETVRIQLQVLFLPGLQEGSTQLEDFSLHYTVCGTNWNKNRRLCFNKPWYKRVVISRDPSSMRQKSPMAEWLEQASKWHEMYRHDLEVMSSNPDWVELGVCNTSVLSHIWTKKTI